MFGPPRRSSRSRGSRSRRRDDDDYDSRPPVSFFTNPFASSSSSRRPSSQPFEEDPFSRRTRSRGRSYIDEDEPSYLRPSTSRRPSERPFFTDPFSTRPSFRDPFDAERRSAFSPPPRRTSSRANDYEELPPQYRRRGAADYSANAFDRYDPFNGELGTGGRRRPSVYGDSELPAYRSASEYARGSASRPPPYEYFGAPRRRSPSPPRYTSFDDQGGYGEPRQYPSTRRPSYYYQTEERRPDDYSYRKD